MSYLNRHVLCGIYASSYRKPSFDEVSLVFIYNPSLNFNTPKNTILLPTTSSGIYNFTVDWGDNKTSFIRDWNDTSCLHVYPNETPRIIQIKGIFTQLKVIYNNLSYIEILQWGVNNYTYFNETWKSCANLKNTALDKINTELVTSFKGA